MKLVPEHINEAIKHLSPQSDEKISASAQQLPYFDQFKLACTQGIVWLVKKLIEEKNIGPNLYNLGLLYASQEGHSDVVKYFLSLPEIDPTDLDSVCIRSAVYYQHKDVVKLLLKDGRADPTANDLELVKDIVYNSPAKPNKQIVDLLMKDDRFYKAYLKFTKSKRFKNHPRYRSDSETYEM